MGKVAVFGLALMLVNPLFLAIRAELVAGLIVLILAGGYLQHHLLRF